MKIVAFLLVLFVSTSSQAFLYVEPYIGYNRGQEQSNALQGIGLGLRLGIDLHDFFIVADIDYADVQQGTLSSVKYTDTGVDFGIRLQNIRLWYGIISNSQFSYVSAGNTNTTKGTGNKVGLGVMTSSSKMSVNMEVRSLSFTSNDAGAGAGASPITEYGTVGFLGVGWEY